MLRREEKRREEKIYSLTSLRFIMMLMIVVSHMGYFEKSRAYNLHFDNAYMAVNYFFMISGFGVTYTVLINNKNVYEEKGIIAKYKYAFSKIKKIYKLYIITMLAYIPLQLYQYIIQDGKTLIFGICMTVVKILCVVPVMQSFTGRSSFTHALNSVGWFLSTLFILHMFYPNIQQWNRKILNDAKKIKIRIGILLILYYITAKLFYWIEDYSLFDKLEYCSPFIRFIPFTIGMLLCDMLLMERNNEKHGTIKEVSILACVVCWFYFRNALLVDELNKNILIFKEIVDIVIVSLLIYVFSHEEGFISKFFNNDWCVLLGNVTMYIYLIHYPVISYLNFIFATLININNCYSNMLITVSSVILTGFLTMVCVIKRKSA